jgi:hypothetical protein
VVPSLRAIWWSDGEAVRRPTTTFQLSAGHLHGSQDSLIYDARKSERLPRVAARDDAARRGTLVRLQFPFHVPVPVRALAVEEVLQHRDVQVRVAERAVEVLLALLRDAPERACEFLLEVCGVLVR